MRKQLNREEFTPNIIYISNSYIILYWTMIHKLNSLAPGPLCVLNNLVDLNVDSLWNSNKVSDNDLYIIAWNFLCFRMLISAKLSFKCTLNNDTRYILWKGLLRYLRKSLDYLRSINSQIIFLFTGRLQIFSFSSDYYIVFPAAVYILTFFYRNHYEVLLIIFEVTCGSITEILSA